MPTIGAFRSTPPIDPPEVAVAEAEEPRREAPTGAVCCGVRLSPDAEGGRRGPVTCGLRNEREARERSNFAGSGASMPRDVSAAEGAVMSGHQEFKALSSDEVQRAAERIAEMEKWAREAYLSTKHVEDVEDIWVRYFEAEHGLHWIIPAGYRARGALSSLCRRTRRPRRRQRCGRRSPCRCCASTRAPVPAPAGLPPG